MDFALSEEQEGLMKTASHSIGKDFFSAPVRWGRRWPAILRCAVA